MFKTFQSIREKILKNIYRKIVKTRFIGTFKNVTFN